MTIPHSPHAPLNLGNLKPVGICDRCAFLYPLDSLTEQRQWAGTTTVGLGLLCCPRCLDELQENGLRTIVIGPDPAPLKRPRPPYWSQQAAPSIAPQFVLEDVPINYDPSGFSSDDFSSSDFSTDDAA